MNTEGIKTTPQARITGATFMDIQKLSEKPAAYKGRLITSVLADYRSHNFTEAESLIAEEIFRLLCRDAEITIRAALARELAHCPDAPHDVIMYLAHDENSVALPILEFSQSLIEEELILLVRSSANIVKQCAIARRETLSQDLAKSLLETSDTLVLHTLFTNKGAMLTEENLLHYWQDIPFTQPLLEALVKRGNLPLSIVEKLYSAVSNELKSHLTRLYPRHSPAIAKAAQDAREWELLGISPHENTIGYDEDIAEDFIDDSYQRGRLTHSLLMRALCVGNLAVFEMGIARLADIPRINARLLLMESSGKGFAGIYQAAGLPDGFFEAVHVLLRISLEETEFGRVKHNDFRKRVIDRIYIERYNHTVENMEYLLSIIGGRMIPAHAH